MEHNRLFLLSMKRLASLLPVALAVGSCLSDPEPGEFCPPRIAAVRSDVERNVVVLSCEVEGKSGVKECGFMFGTDEEALDRNTCVWSGDGNFSMTVEGLTFDVDYWYSSFISSGRDEQRSGLKHFKIQQRLPEIEILTVTDWMSTSAVVEYSVGENFSGELIVCGLCWSTGPEPTFESEGKTVDSARYGTHRTRITGLTLGQDYHVRAYAINAKGTVYSGELKFYTPVTFEDKAFSDYMLGIGDADGDGRLSLEEAGNIREINLCTDGVESLDGMENCTLLAKLRCRGSAPGKGKLKAVDLSGLTELEELDLGWNSLAGIDLSANGKLRSARLGGNSIENLKLPESSALESLGLENNMLRDMQLPGLPNLASLDLSDNALTDIQLSGLPRLASLGLSGNSLESFRIADMPALAGLDLSGNRIASADLDGLASLKTLDFSGNPLAELLLLQTPEIEELDLGGTELTGLTDIFKKVRGLKRLNVRGVLHDEDKIYILSELEELDCSGSGITEINLRFNRALKKVSAADCRGLASLDVCLNDRLEALDCRGCSSLRSIFMVEDQKIDGINANLSSGLTRPAEALPVYSSRIGDPVFAKYLTDKFDRDYDGFVCVTEVADVEEVAVDAAEYPGISSVHGLEMFRSLKKLSLPGQKINLPDLSANAELTDLNCDSNPLSGLLLDGCVHLRNLYCQSAGLTEIDLSACPELTAAHLYNNSLKSLDCSANTRLQTLDCSRNALEGVLDLSGCTELRRLDCSDNPKLSGVIVSGESVEIVKDAGCTVVKVP